MNDLNLLFEQGCEAVRQKDYKRAQQLLQEVIKQDKRHLEAWLWLAQTQPDARKQLKCIQQALAIDPQHAVAQKMLQQVSQKLSRTTKATDDAAHVAGLGRQLLHIRMSWKNQFQRLFVGVACAAIIGIIYYYTDLPNYLQLAISERSLFVETVWYDFMDFLLVLIFVTAILYSIFTMIMALGQELTVYENGVKHSLFGDERSWMWSDFHVGKFTNRLTTNRVYGIPLSKTHTYKLVLHSDKGKLVLSDVFENHVEAGKIIEQRASSFISFEPQERNRILRWLSN